MLTILLFQTFLQLFYVKVITFQINWEQFADAFVSGLGLKRQHCTTQIEHYDVFTSLLDAMKRINVIL